ncbi:MAG: signal peptidase I [Candidatus Thorarchaeota archaeon]|nr:signal peptidase I [Candidatus Thorarchaeota archaeon]
MQKLRQKLKWGQRSDTVKTAFFMVLFVGFIFGGYGVFTIAMGTPTPLVVVTSGSMSPTLERGYLLVLQKHAPGNILVGDIVVYKADWHTEAPVVHRVIQREFVDGEYRYYTQGDANSEPDIGYRTYDDIVGVVILSIPWIGNITLFLQQPGVLPVILVLLVILIFLPDLLPKKDNMERTATTQESGNDIQYA